MVGGQPDKTQPSGRRDRGSMHISEEDIILHKIPEILWFDDSARWPLGMVSMDPTCILILMRLKYSTESIS
ncbi:hypothetical protein JHK87_033686 [Glycine soja]|nr:hypothetical protein JHK87_033686 [Glycine soja]